MNTKKKEEKKPREVTYPNSPSYGMAAPGLKTRSPDPHSHWPMLRMALST